MTQHRGRHKPHAQRIYTDTGKTAGFITGTHFDKRIDSTKHVLRHPFRRIAFDVSTLERAQAAGATQVRITFFDIPDILTAPIAKILSDGRTEKSFGHGRQVSWPYALFTDENKPTPEPDSRQPTLFDELERTQ